MNSTQTLNILLEKLVLLPPDLEEKIRAQWPNMNEAAQVALIKTLEGTLGEQEAMIRKIVEKDPQFVDRLNAFLRDQVSALKKEEGSFDASALSQIEEQIDSK